MGSALAYQATKGAGRLMTKSVPVQYAKEHIRINSIRPGLITTLMVTQSIDLESRKGFEQATPMGHEGTVEIEKKVIARRQPHKRPPKIRLRPLL